MRNVWWYVGVVICAFGWGGLALLLFIAAAMGGLSDGIPPLQDPPFWAFCGFWLALVSVITAVLVSTPRRVE